MAVCTMCIPKHDPRHMTGYAEFMAKQKENAGILENASASSFSFYCAAASHWSPLLDAIYRLARASEPLVSSVRYRTHRRNFNDLIGTGVTYKVCGERLLFLSMSVVFHRQHAFYRGECILLSA